MSKSGQIDRVRRTGSGRRAIRKAARGRMLLLEALEDRTLFALLGIPTDLPSTLALNSSTGSLTYNSTTEQFSDVATPVTFTVNSTTSVPITAPRAFTINAFIDNNGNVVGPETSTDLTIVGNLNLSAYGGGDYSGVLLTGEMTQFGSDDSTGTAEYDARLTPTGGALISYFTGQDIGLFITSENSTFTGSFTSDFNGETKALVGPIPLLTPTISTTPGSSVAVGSGVPMTDSATLSGGYDETGNITFNLYNSSNAVVDTETVAVNGPGTYTTPTGYLPSSAGTYEWLATYSGDGTNSSVASPLGSEPETAGPASPSITTTPSQSTVTLGTSPVTLTDTAVLSGGDSETGSITFNLYYDGGNTPVDTETVSVNGNGSYTTPAGYTLPSSGTVTGTYQWDASYSGDSNNSAASDNNDPNETVSVSAASPTITTAAYPNIFYLGTSSLTLTDTAVLSGGYAPTGSITFNLYYINSSTFVDTETVSVNGDGTYTTPTGYTLPTSVPVTGAYEWYVSYGGDSNNKSANDGTPPRGSESTEINPARPTLVTTPNTSSVSLGTSPVTLTDTAVLSGGYYPTGEIIFQLMYNSTTVDSETVQVNGNGSYTTPTGYTLPTSGTVTGSYQWNAQYVSGTGSGLQNNDSAEEYDNPNEAVAVSSASPSFSTTPLPNTVTLGTTSVLLQDRAVLSGGYDETGTITFTLYYNGGATPVDTETDPVDSNGSYTTPVGYSPPTSAAATGEYQWDASYSGDGNNNSVSENGASNERVNIGAASPTLSTTPASAVVVGSGTYLNDSANLACGYSPTGSITFTLYNSASAAVYTDTVTVNGDGTYTTAGGNNSGGYLPTATGTYQWVASYGGDSNNNGATSTLGSEPETVSSASPSISTTPGGTIVIGSGSKLSDSATLSGGYSPTGSITFTLYNSASTAVYTDTITISGDGTYTTASGNNSGGYLPTATGTYQWVASYGGDSNNNGATSTLGSEPDTVSVGTPSISTTPGGTLVIGSGSKLSDSATLSGGASPTGSITFTLYNSSSTAVYTDTVTISGDGTYTTASGNNSGGYLPTATGTYQWVASYSGDASNTGTTSTLGSEPETVSSASPSISTTPGGTLVIGSGSKLSDSATLSGGSSPTGTITFTLYNAASTAVYTDTVTISGDGTYTTAGGTNSGGYLPTATGTYQWVASYGGDSNNSGATSTLGSEPQTVSSASPAINTTPGGTIVIGSGTKLSDSATLSGGYSPTGTITFTLYNSASTAVYTDTVTLSGDGTYTTASGTNSGGYLPTATGTYQWVASYGGDSNNSGATSTLGSEPETVSTASPSISTTPGGTFVIGSGSKLSDSATLSGGSSPTGTITFTLYNSASTAVYTDTVTLSGDGTYTTASGTNSGGYLPTATGTYQWVASYSGDSNNSGATSTLGSEPETVSTASPSISTTPGGTLVIGSGTKLSDSATLSGGYSPTGTITFTLYNAASTAVYTDTVTLSGDGTYTTASGTNSGGYLPTATGTYQWVAAYSGDSNNATVTSSKGSEPETVSSASPSISTTPGGTIVIGSGTKLSDSATLSGGYSPTGTITFTLYNSASAAVYTDTVTISGDGTYTTASGTNSGGYLPTVTGTYQWAASYSGDSNNSSASSAVGSEPETVSSASPSISTTPGGTIVIGSGTKLSDSATLSGGYSPTGTITFTLYNSASTAVYTDSVTISGDGTYTTASGTNSGGYLPTAIGTYQWVAAYSGDSNNGGVTSSKGSEPETVNSASPSISTTPGGSVALGSGTKLSDSATLSGGYSETGTLTFTLYNPSSTVVYTDVVTVSGNGTYTTASGNNSGGYLPTVIGTYQWVAAYSGDSNNAAVTSSKGSEPEIVTTCTPTLTTTPGGSVVIGSGSKLSDSATLAGGSSPTGTITFTLYNPSNSVVYTDVVTISGNGTYTTSSGTESGGYTPTAIGTYEWVAAYSGDSNNVAITSPKGSEPEAVSSTITISGTKYQDLTGNGFTNDTPQAGVVIDLYEESNGTAGLQTGTGGDTLVATTTTASNGTYSFTNLMAGTYYVQEVVPSGYVQTGGGPNGTAGDSYYTVNAAWCTSYGNNNFADYQIPTCNPTNVSYCIDNDNSLTTVSSLRGNTQQGESVTVTFTVTAGMSDQLTLISYIAPSATYSSSTAYEQTIYDEATGTFGPGTHTLTVLIPNCYYQVDFVCGTALSPLVPTTGGPDSANINYTSEDRLISADNGGTKAYAAAAVASGTFGTAAYWATTTGQTVIKSLNGSATATALGQWLATNFPNLYGAAAGAYSMVNSGGTYFTNTQIASAYSKFTGAAEQVLSTALSVYATSIDLAGINVHSIDSHITTSAEGSGMETYSVGTNGAAFGLANNTTATVMQLLEDLNTNTAAGAAPATGANTIFTAINTAGGVST